MNELIEIAEEFRKKLAKRLPAVFLVKGDSERSFPKGCHRKGAYFPSITVKEQKT